MHLFADPEFWVLLAVMVFAAIVWKPARNYVIGTLDERAMRIRGELEEARKLRDEAEQLLTEYQRMDGNAPGEADTPVFWKTLQAAFAPFDSSVHLTAKGLEQPVILPSWMVLGAGQ